MAAINQASERKAIIFSKRLIDNLPRRNKDEDSNVEEQRTKCEHLSVILSFNDETQFSYVLCSHIWYIILIKYV